MKFKEMLLVLLILFFIYPFIIILCSDNQRNRTMDVMYEYSDKPGVLYPGNHIRK